MLDGGGGVAGRVADRLRLSKVQRKRLAAMLEPMRGATPGATDAALHEAIYRHGAALVRDALSLAWARADESSGWRAQDAVVENWKRPSLPLTGADVLALGVEPGERVGQLLTQVETWWIEQDFAPDRKACLAKLATLV
jgi:poly(A) polymerase